MSILLPLLGTGFFASNLAYQTRDMDPVGMNYNDWSHRSAPDSRPQKSQRELEAIAFRIHNNPQNTRNLLPHHKTPIREPGSPYKPPAATPIPKKISDGGVYGGYPRSSRYPFRFSGHRKKYKKTTRRVKKKKSKKIRK